MSVLEPVARILSAALCTSRHWQPRPDLSQQVGYVLLCKCAPPAQLHTGAILRRKTPDNVLLLPPPPQRLVSYFAGDNEDSRKFKPTVPLNSVLLTADRQSETVKGKFFFGSYLPDELQVRHWLGVADPVHPCGCHSSKLPHRTILYDTVIAGLYE